VRGILIDAGVAVNPLEKKGVTSLRKDNYESLRKTLD
jgi:hypothetical protein